MLFSVGTKVRFLHSKDEGVVTSLLDGGMVNVLLNGSNFEIPAFADDLVRAEDYSQAPSSSPAKLIKIPPRPKDSPPALPAIESQYTILKGQGIQLAFDPVLRPDGQAEKYHIFLLNDTRNEALFTFELHLGERRVFSRNGKLGPMTTLELGELLFDQLNESPNVELSCWRITTQGTGSRQHKSLRIKPKVFFKNVRTAPLLNRQVHLFRLFEQLDDQPKTSTPASEDLKDYTKRLAQPAFKSNYSDVHARLPHEVVELAEFIPEIDLHIEKLVANPQKLSKADILRIQLQHFDAYLDKAIRLGVDRVFIIHGLGKGRLRDAIASRLVQMEAVRSFRNEYHPRYGYGATEVVF
jgi:hypothetical protein